MNFLFDIGHPAHVHLFRNLILYLRARGHSVTITSRQKDVTEQLLTYYGMNFHSLSKPRVSFAGMFVELLQRNSGLFSLHKKIGFDAGIGTSASIGFLNRKYNVPAYNFNEDDDNVVKLYSYLAYPHATSIFNPDCINYTRWKEKRVLYPSYHELAYLHPDNFIPDISVPKSYGLKPHNYVIIRLSALKAHHDKGMKGISVSLYKKIVRSLGNIQILDSHELKGSKIAPWDIHNILAFARMIISDSQTMTIEGSILGIPAIRVNTFIGKSTVIAELENKYKLAFGLFPHQEKEIISLIDKIISDPESQKKWKEKKDQMLKEKVNLNSWMIKYFEENIIL